MHNKRRSEWGIKFAGKNYTSKNIKDLEGTYAMVLARITDVNPDYMTADLEIAGHDLVDLRLGDLLPTATLADPSVHQEGLRKEIEEELSKSNACMEDVEAQLTAVRERNEVLKAQLAVLGGSDGK